MIIMMVNIYSSNYVNGAWTPIKKLNKNINTKFYESHASISPMVKNCILPATGMADRGISIFMFLKKMLQATGDRQ